jgi:6-phosphogluconolactonase (cycloisomerase 2 family)
MNRIPSALLVLAAIAPCVSAHSTGVVFTQTNASAGNSVLAFHRSSTGALTPVGTFATDGLGNGGGLGSQGAVTLSSNRKFLLVVNAGSNSVSVFRFTHHGMELSDVEPSRGTSPTSVTERQGRVYVLNAGMNSNVAGFTLSSHGELTPLAAAPSALSAPSVAPAQVAIAPDRSHVFVTERATNLIDVFPILSGGGLGMLTSLPSAGATPFGFEFGRNDTLIVSEAFGGMPDASAVSSYLVDGTQLQAASSSVPTTETAACWIAITKNGRFAYTTNTGSGTVTGYSVDAHSGAIASLDADGVTGDLGAGANPLDASLSRSSRFLFVLSPATHEIAVFRVRHDGRLDKCPSRDGIPESAAGLASL